MMKKKALKKASAPVPAPEAKPTAKSTAPPDDHGYLGDTQHVALPVVSKTKTGPVSSYSTAKVAPTTSSAPKAAQERVGLLDSARRFMGLGGARKEAAVAAPATAAKPAKSAVAERRRRSSVAKAQPKAPDESVDDVTDVLVQAQISNAPPPPPKHQQFWGNEEAEGDVDGGALSQSASVASNSSGASRASSVDIVVQKRSGAPRRRSRSLTQPDGSDAAAAVPPGPPPTVGRFRIDYGHELGAGGFGVVYRAFDTQDGSYVAVKETIVGRESQERVEASMRAEFDILTKLDHPHVVRVLHFAVMEGRSRIVMEWMPMGSVHGMLRSIGFRLHERVVRRFALEALKGLQYLHGRGIIHRDVKPANMLVSGTGAVKLSDFGTSREVMLTTAPSTQHTVGTPCYLSREAIAEGRYSRASDIWALACSVVEMATGDIPWGHLPQAQRQPIPLMFHIGTSQPPNHCPRIPGHLSAELRELLERCFALDASERPSAEQLLAEPYFVAAAAQSALPESAEAVDVFEALLAEAGARIPTEQRSTWSQSLSVVESAMGRPLSTQYSTFSSVAREKSDESNAA